MTTTDTPAPADQAAPEPQRLDDVLLAMDVVDTLRHREQLVARELDADLREEELIERLREIYTAQGISVPDHILKDGVKALQEQRFVYTPPRNGPMVRLAHLYVSRGKWMRPAGLIGAVALAGLGAYQFGIAGPERARAEAITIERTETLPNQLTTLRDSIQASTNEDLPMQIAESLYQDGIAALDDNDLTAARGFITELETLERDLSQIYEVRVRYRNGAQSGIFRIPENAPETRNYYLIVEAANPRGEIVEVPITDEEDLDRSRVSSWAQRVTQDVFNRVAADKRDDQIIQNAVIGHKPAGRLTPIFTVDAQSGALTEW